MKKKFIISIITCLLLTNCATLFSGTANIIKLKPSDKDYEKPIDVEVKTKKITQKTQIPGTITLPSSIRRATVTVKDKCFRETDTILRPRASGWTAIPAYFLTTTASPSVTTDVLTGSVWVYDKEATIDTQPNGICK